MAHPKRKISVTRRNKRRTHKHSASEQGYSICSVTGEAHLPHRAYWHEDKLYYKGRVLQDRKSTEEGSSK